MKLSFKLFFAVLSFGFLPIHVITAQVTIGSGISPSKAALLDIKEEEDTDGDENAHAGLKMPRVRLTDLANLYPMFTGLEADYSTQKIINRGLVVYNVNTNTPFKEGLYNWDGVQWKPIEQASTSPTQNIWTTDLANSLIKLGMKSDGIATRSAGTEFVIKDNGSVGLGTSSPNASAILDLSSTNKALLAPRVALTSYNDVATIATPVAGMLVYNTGTGSLKYAGYIYWNGSEWRSVNNTTTVNPSIATIDCSNAVLTPIAYTSGTAYTGSLKVPYIDGNGGAYAGGTQVVVNGLTFKLLAGSLAYGSGYLEFSVTGTPTVSSPTPSNIAINSTLIPFYTGGGCTTSEIGVSETKSGEFVTTSFNIDNNAPTTSLICFDGGRLCIRYNGTTANQQLQVRHTYGNAQVLIAYSFWGAIALVTGSPSSGTNAQRNTNLANNTWTNLYDYGSANNTEGQITQFSLVDKVTNQVRSFQVIGDIVVRGDIGGSIDKMFLRIVKN